MYSRNEDQRTNSLKFCDKKTVVCRNKGSGLPPLNEDSTNWLAESCHKIWGMANNRGEVSKKQWECLSFLFGGVIHIADWIIPKKKNWRVKEQP